MISRIFFLLPLALCGLSIALLAFAEEPAPTVDLGSVSVTGKIRRPPTQWIESTDALSAEAREILREEFEALEKEALATPKAGP